MLSSLPPGGSRPRPSTSRKPPIRASRKRFPNSTVDYLSADLLEPLSVWHRTFDFVFEANTLQVLPAGLRPRSIENIVQFLRSRGLLLLFARGLDPSAPEVQLPW